MTLKFTPLASGSKANAYLIESEKAKILVDFGLSIRRGISLLDEAGVVPEEIDGIFVTHIHTDHIKNVCKFAKKFDLPVYANDYTVRYLRLNHSDSVEYIVVGKHFAVNDLEGSVFATFHDAPASVAVSLASGGSRATIITDTGKYSPVMREFAELSDVLVLESNYDEEMLATGPYPPFLKKRIASARGHLSNSDALAFTELCRFDKLKTLYLGHLSAHNNSPGLVERLFQNEFRNKRMQDVRIEIAHQDLISYTCETNQRVTNGIQ